MDLDKVAKRLNERRASIDKGSILAAPGVCAVFLRGKPKFPIAPASSDGLIYVGKSSDLAERAYSGHFSSSGSGFSTLRRSIGALLKEQLALVAVPRGKGNSKSNYTQYRFDNAGDDRLTTWIKQNLEIGVCRIDADTKAVEKD